MIELSFGLVTIVLCSASLLLELFCLVTPYWMYYPGDEEDKTFIGLWQVCKTKELTTVDVHVCQAPNYISDNMQVTRTVEIFGVMLILAALACAVLEHFDIKRHDKLLKTGEGCGVVAGGMMMVGVLSLIYEVTSEGQVLSGLKFHASFGLTVVSSLLAFAAGVIFFLWDRKTSASRLAAPQNSVGSTTVTMSGIINEQS